MAFQYRQRTPDAWNKRANQQGSNYAGVIQDRFNVFGAKEGENAIRILPPTWENPEHYGHDIWVHFNVGPEGGTVLCLSRMKHQPCPICEWQAKAETAGREDAKDYKPKRRVAIWLIDKKAEKPEDNPAIWTMGWTTDRDISVVCKDRESGQLYMIDHPTAGYDVFFNKSGKGDQTKYIGFSISRRESSVEQKYLDFVVQNPIPAALLWRTYEEIQFLFEGEAAPKTDVTQQATTQPANGVATEVPHQASAPSQAAPIAAPPPRAFVSEWVMDNNQVINCGTCGKPLYTISPEEATCEGAHRVSLESIFAPPPPPPTQQPGPPPPVQAPQPPIVKATPAPLVPGATAPPAVTSAMRSRFETGQK